MTVGERIKKIRKQRKMSAEEVAARMNISVSTLYRYENSSITKIPVAVINQLCAILGTTTGELLGTLPDTESGSEELPVVFANAADAMTFVLKMPVLAAYGGYDVSKMEDETIIEFANEILNQLKLVSYKYK